MVNNKRLRIERKMIWLSLLLVILLLPFINAAAEFEVSNFVCTPAEVPINDGFSCTATIKNSGDATGTVSTATLYPDSNDWLEDASYAQAYGEDVDAGNTFDVTFTGLIPVKSGNNGFSKITLDSVTDTWVDDNNVKENVIDVVVTVSNSVSSAAMDVNFDTTATVIAGGNIDVDLTLTVDSGGCSIGNQDNPKTISDMSDGNQQSKSWEVTMGSSGNCKFTITAAATGNGGIASKTDSTTSTITCTDCPEEEDDSGGSSSGGSSGSGSSGSGGSGSSGTAGVGTTAIEIDELDSIYNIKLKDGENFKFKLDGEEHAVSLIKFSATAITIIVESDKKEFDLSVGQKINADLNGDEWAEISVKLDSVNIITKEARIIVSPLERESVVADRPKGVEDEAALDKKESKLFWLWILIGVVVAIVVFIVVVKIIRSNKPVKKKIRKGIVKTNTKKIR